MSGITTTVKKGRSRYISLNEGGEASARLINAVLAVSGDAAVLGEDMARFLADAGDCGE